MRGALEQLAHATERYHVAGGDALEHKVAAIAAKLGFGSLDLARPVASLSGGERGRLHLGVQSSRSSPNLLLLDEPTNRPRPRHHRVARRLASRLSRRCACRLARPRVPRRRPSTTSRASGARASASTRSLQRTARSPVRTTSNASVRSRSGKQAFVEKTEDFIRRNIAGQKTKQAQSRRKMLGEARSCRSPRGRVGRRRSV